MNTKLLLLVISVAAFSSCTTLYKSGQTPDDVYYSPARPAGGGDVAEDRRERQNYLANNYDSDDRVIRLGINDARWRYLDYNYNYSNSLYITDYSYNPYIYGFNYGYYYNPFYWPYPVYGYGSGFVKNSTPKNTTPRMANLGSYNPAYNPTRQSSYRTHGGTLRPARTYNNSNRGSAVGNVMRQVFAPSNSNSNNSNNNINNSSSSNRTYSPSSSGSSSSGSSSSGSGSVSRPARH